MVLSPDLCIWYVYSIWHRTVSTNYLLDIMWGVHLQNERRVMPVSIDLRKYNMFLCRNEYSKQKGPTKSSIWLVLSPSSTQKLLSWILGRVMCIVLAVEYFLFSWHAARELFTSLDKRMIYIVCLFKYTCFISIQCVLLCTCVFSWTSRYLLYHLLISTELMGFGCPIFLKGASWFHISPRPSTNTECRASSTWGQGAMP